MMGTALADEFDVDLPVIEAIQAGDRYAFAELVQRHGSWVRAVVFGVLGRSDGIDDVVQQVWTSVWQRIRELRDPARWRPWLYRMARNAAVDAGREISRRRRLHKSAPDGVLAGQPDRVDARDPAAAERHRLVMAAINGLPALYREPFVLRHLNDWSYQQIADVMDMPVDSVETRLVRARRLLREALENKVG
jgi:RNA polymerase sigma-70 factor, ECF subfamily